MIWWLEKFYLAFDRHARSMSVILVERAVYNGKIRSRIIDNASTNSDLR
jgi:hypothetical protein